MGLSCEINFDHHRRSLIFKAGGEVSGSVVFNCKKSSQIKYIQLRIVGYGRVKWSKLSQSEGNLCKCRKYPAICFQGMESYINESQTLLAAGEESSIKLPPSKKTFRFSFRIPEGCPPSFQSQHAEVKYSVKVIVARPWKCLKSFEREFTVKQNVDLNSNAKAQLPSSDIDISHNKYDGYPVSIKICIPYSGFVSGQFIPLTINLKKYTSVKVLKVKILLHQLALLQAETPRITSKLDRTIILKKLLNTIGNGNKYEEDILELIRVPPLISSTTQNLSKIIKISYEIEVLVQVSSFKRYLSATLPIIIGNVPLDDVRGFSSEVAGPPICYKYGIDGSREQLI